MDTMGKKRRQGTKREQGKKRMQYDEWDVMMIWKDKRSDRYDDRI